MSGDNPITRLLAMVGGQKPQTLDPVFARRPPNRTEPWLEELIASPLVQDTLHSLLGVSPRYATGPLDTREDMRQALVADAWVRTGTPNRVDFSPLLSSRTSRARGEEILSHENVHSADFAGLDLDQTIFRGSGLERRWGRNPFSGLPVALDDMDKMEARAYTFESALRLLRSGDRVGEREFEEAESRWPGTRQVYENIRRLLEADEEIQKKEREKASRLRQGTSERKERK